MSQSPTIARTGFGEGAGWLIAGSESLARGGPAMLRVALVLLAISLVQLIPAIGPLILLVISQAVTAGVLNVFRAVDQGEPVAHDTVLQGLMRPDRRGRLLALGTIFVLGMFAALAAFSAWLSPQMDMQALTTLLNDPEVLNREPEKLFVLFEGVNVIGGLAIAGVIAVLVLGSLYFAVPLVFFWGWPVIAALLWSLRAVLVNWIAFLGFVLVLFGVLVIIGLGLGLFGNLILLALGPMGTPIAQLLTMAVSLFVQLLIAAAQWRAFLRVFPAGDSGNDSTASAEL